LDEPIPDIVGHLINVNCGHTGHPTPSETLLMEMHLRQALFFDEKNTSLK